MIDNNEIKNELIEGRNAVIEALRAGRAIDKIFLARGDVDKTLGHIASKAREKGIVVVESDRRKVCVYAGGERVESYKTLTQLKPLLGDGFVHCHKSFLVNMARVRQLEPDMLLLENGEKIPVSRKLKKQTKEQFLQYLAQQL